MTGPKLSNYLSVLAVEVAGEVAAFKRSSTAAHVAYLAAGWKLVEARGSTRRGEWAPFLEACGIEARTARNMMTLARAGLTADDVTAAGGVRGALDAVRGADAGEKTETISAIDTPAEPSKSAISGPQGAPIPHGARPVAHETGLAAGESRSVQADAPTSHRSSLQGAQPADSAGDGERTLETDPARGMTLYAWRRAMGLCTTCGEPSDGKARCPGCARALADRRTKAAELARIGRNLAPRIEAARRAGRGVRLTAAEVARLAGRRETTP